MNIKLNFLSFIFIFSFFSPTNAQELTSFPSFFGNCYYQDDIEISKQEFKDFILSNDLSKAYWEKANQQQTIAIVSLGFELGLFFAAFKFNDSPNDVFYVGAAAAGIASIIYSFKSNNSRKRSILAYNSGLDGKYSLKLDATNNGFGIVMGF